ncbi:MAG TPA: hypothetical protein ACFYEC_05355, partial [Candidatus Brocadiaceae bacterium]
MAKPVLIIDFDSISVNAGVFAAGKMEMLRYFAMPREDELKTTLSLLLREISSKGFSDFSQTIVGIPYTSISVRIASLPFSEKKKLDEVVPFEARDLFLKGSEALILETLPLADGKVIVAALEKEIVGQYLGMLKELGIDPVWIGASIFSKDRLLNKLYDGDGVAAFLDTDALVVIKGKKPVIFKGIHGIDDLRLALLSLQEDGIEIKQFYAVSQMCGMLRSLIGEAVSINQQTDGNRGVPALASHFKEGLRHAVNFRKGEFAYTRELESTRKDLKAAAFLLAIFVGLWGTYSYLRYQTLNDHFIKLKNMLGSDYRNLFRGEGKIVDPLYQLEVKLKYLKEEKKIIKGGVNVLEVMRKLSEIGNKEDRARLYAMHIQPGRITANG